MPEKQIDFAAEGLLDGLEGEARADRLGLLEDLVAEGWPLEELRRQTANGTIVFLPSDRVVAGGTRYTAAELAELGGVDPDFLVTLRRAMGLPIAEPDEAVYTDAELESARLVHVARAAGVSDEEIVELMRLLGRVLSQAAEALREYPLRRAVTPGVSERELSHRFAQAVTELYPLVNPMLANILLLHLRAGTQVDLVNAIERQGGQLPGAREVTVCFADLVGFTRLGEEVPPDELGRLAGTLEALASDVAERPVRLVKTIGDAAMLASLEPEPLLEAALTLLEAADAEGEDFPQVRVGSAIGQALSRAGDWFGRPVNLASRITAIARPGSLLAERELRECVPDTYRWSYAGERRLRGVREPVPLFRARRLGGSGAGREGAEDGGAS